LPSEYNSGGIGAPYVQIRILRCLRQFCVHANRGDDVGGASTCDIESSVLACVRAVAPLNTAIMCALLIECATTLATLQPRRAAALRAVADSALPLLSASAGSASMSGSISLAQSTLASSSVAGGGARTAAHTFARAAALSALKHVGALAMSPAARVAVVDCLDSDDDAIQV
jgi:hypothetical protein